MEKSNNSSLNINQDSINEKEDIYINYIFPSLSHRIKALFIDGLIIFLIFWGSSYIFDFLNDENPAFRAIIFLFFIFLYEPTLIYFFKGTVGHQIMNLKVTEFNNPEKRLNLISALFRFFMKWVLGWLSFISIFFNKNNRAIHDIASNSIVTFFEDEKSN